MGLKIGGTVEKVNGKELTYADFVEKYLEKNQPVILTGLTDDWRACKDWVSDDGKPNLRFFSDHFGGSRVQVADCVTREFTDQKRVEMSVSEFIEHWLSVSCSDNGGADGKSLLYLKDWHFVKACPGYIEFFQMLKRQFGSAMIDPNYIRSHVLALWVGICAWSLGNVSLMEYTDYVAYCTPIFFLDDWLNLYLDMYRMHDDPDSYGDRNEITCSDYRFVYMGAKGTWTPLHSDVFRSYSWSANVCGRKQWYFLSPSQHHLVFDRYMKSSVYDIFEDVCKSKYPGFEKAVWWECTQEQNEIIFVPSGWYHQVHNLEDTISINHNWFNAYNISWVWDLLLREYHEAKGYIEDIKDICDDFEGLCQRNLAANAGMDFRDFFIFMIRFALANFVLLYQLISDRAIINWSSSQMAQPLLFNLKKIKCITLKMKSVAAWENRGVGVIDLMETIEDQSFAEFCNALGRTYSIMYNNREMNFNSNQILLEHKQLNLLDPLCSHICNPDELVTFVDCALKLAGTEG